jgi:uncharacterized protein
MDKTRLEIVPKVWLDYRRAIYLEEHSVLAVADLHLGYAWAHRYNGQMLPFGGGDRLAGRLSDLCSSYTPRVIAMLGDVVHQAVPVQEVAEDLRSLLHALSASCEPRIVLGNHDKKLKSLLGKERIELTTSLRFGRFMLLHGDSTAQAEPGLVNVMGHEHPAISLGDGIMGTRFPCFLVSDSVIVLPAFSLWAAGTDIRSQSFMSALAQEARFEKAVGICGDKLLPVLL